MTKTTCTFCSESFITSTAKNMGKECQAHPDAEWEQAVRAIITWHKIRTHARLSHDDSTLLV